MKHYAPNRCLYIKVAKLSTGVGSAEMSHLQNCCLKIYLKRALGGGGVGLGGQDGCEQRIKGGGGRVWGGGQGRYEQRNEVFVKIQKKLELMFMKHYAPNRCLYIKVAKLRTGVGSAEMSHLQNRCLKISG